MGAAGKGVVRVGETRTCDGESGKFGRWLRAASNACVTVCVAMWLVARLGAIQPVAWRQVFRSLARMHVDARGAALLVAPPHRTQLKRIQRARVKRAKNATSVLNTELH